MGELYSLLTSRHMLSYLSYTAQDHLAKDGATHSELEFSTSILTCHPLTDMITDKPEEVDYNFQVIL